MHLVVPRLPVHFYLPSTVQMHILDAWKQNISTTLFHIMQLLLSTTLLSSHQGPAEETTMFYMPRIQNWIQVLVVHHFVSTVQRTFSSPVCSCSTSWWVHIFNGLTSECHLIISLYLIFSGSRLSCRLHYLSLPHGHTHSVPTTTCTLEMSGQPVYMPFITPGFAALNTHTHAHTQFECLLLISWFTPLVRVQGLICSLDWYYYHIPSYFNNWTANTAFDKYTFLVYIS